MSINIALIPLALAMRVVMGKDGFEDFVKQSELVRYTNFKNFNEISQFVNKAGYDFKTQYGILKTHYKTNGYFYWEIRDGHLCAIFSVYDDSSDILNFIIELEKAVGKQVFYDSILDLKNNKSRLNNINVENKKQIKPITEQIFKTKFTNKNLLIKALKSIGLNCNQKSNEIICSNDNYTLIFTNKDGIYEFKIIGDVSSKDAYMRYKDIDTRYCKEVQQDVIKNVKEKVSESSSMKFEKEEVLEDNSVVITISL